MAGRRGLPSEFLSRKSSPTLSTRHLRNSTMDLLSNASSISAASWNVCSFLDLRANTDNDLPIALLPIPEDICIYMHYYNHLQPCRRIFIFIQPQHHSQFTRWAMASNVTLVSTDISISYNNACKAVRETYDIYFDPDTVTLCWEPMVLIEHQLLWRPSTDIHESVQFMGEDGALICKSGNNSEPHISRCSQKVWRISCEREYFLYVHHKIKLLSWP